MKENPSYYAIIPAHVRYDKNLCSSAKLLYGEITALSNKYGYCYSTSNYFAKLYGVKRNQVVNWIKQLIECGYVTIEVEDNHKRKIYLYGGGVSKKIQGCIKKDTGGCIKKDTPCNNTSVNNKTNTNIYCTISTKVENDTTHNKTISKQPYTEEFEEAWSSYPRRLGSNSKKSAFKSWNARLKQKVPMSDLTSAIHNYAYYCERTDKLNTEYIMQASRFFGSNEEYKNFITIEVINEDFNKQQKSSNKFDGYAAIQDLKRRITEQE